MKLCHLTAYIFCYHTVYFFISRVSEFLGASRMFNIVNVNTPGALNNLAQRETLHRLQFIKNARCMGFWHKSSIIYAELITFVINGH